MLMQKSEMFGSDSGRDKYAGLLTTAVKTAQSSTFVCKCSGTLLLSPGIGAVG